MSFLWAVLGSSSVTSSLGRRNAYAYIQVSMSIADRGVEEREYRPFGHIRDGYPRYLFTLDPLLQERDGIRHLNMASFMQDGGDLI